MDAIDLYQIHWPEPDEDVEEGWETLARLQEEGKVRWIGVSNFNVAQMERCRAIAPDHLAAAALFGGFPRGRSRRSCRTARSTASA